MSKLSEVLIFNILEIYNSSQVHKFNHYFLYLYCNFYKSCNDFYLYNFTKFTAEVKLSVEYKFIIKSYWYVFLIDSSVI